MPGLARGGLDQYVKNENKEDLVRGHADLDKSGIPSQWVDGWAHRSITRDVVLSRAQLAHSLTRAGLTPART